tara:strand:+ start:136 stop:561 length:426 start_codon:yes stop_codon:yes gene_type:complete
LKKLFTYTLPRPFFGYNIPIAIQSSYLRDYAKKKNYLFSLPVTEIVTQNTYFMLKTKFPKKKIDIAFSSIFIFPLQNSKSLYQIVKCFNKNTKFHFVLENLIMTGSEFLNWQKQFNKIKKFDNNYENFKKRIKNLKVKKKK